MQPGWVFLPLPTRAAFFYLVDQTTGFKMSDRIIYRPPPYVVGPQVFFYNQVEDKKPWSLVKNCVPEHWAETMGEDVVVAILDTGRLSSKGWGTLSERGRAARSAIT